MLRAAIKGAPQLSLSAGGQSQSLTQGEQIAVRAAMNGDKAVSIQNAPLVFLGYGVNAPERNWNDYDARISRARSASC